MQFEALHTQRLVVRKIRPGEAGAIATYRALSAVARFQTAYTHEKLDELIREMQVSDPSVKGKWFQFAIELASEGRLIGDIGFLNSDENSKSWVGYTLNPEYWHFGYAAEAVGEVLDYYAKLGVSEVWASTDPQNFSSMKLLQRLGFALVESKPDDVTFVRRDSRAS